MAFLINTKTGVKGPFNHAQLQAFVDKGQLQLAHKVKRQLDGESLTVAEALNSGEAAAVSVPASEPSAPAPAGETRTQPRRRSRSGAGTNRVTKRRARDSENPYAAPEAGGDRAPRTKRRGKTGRVKYFYRSVKTPALLAQIAIGIHLLLAAYGIIFNMEVSSAIHGDVTEATWLDIEGRANTLFWSSILIFLIAVVLFSYWTNQVAKNSYYFGRKHMSESPAMAVGSYFIPILNLYKPYKIMVSMFKACDLHKKTGLVGAWWTAWIFTSVLNRVASRMADRADSVPSLDTALQAESIGAGLLIVAGVLVILVIQILTKQQHDLEDDESQYEE